MHHPLLKREKKKPSFSVQLSELIKQPSNRKTELLAEASRLIFQKQQKLKKIFGFRDILSPCDLYNA